ncbi:MAG: fatty acid desaturase [Deltaproteobacteria bacterium]|nr:fatty acid desaturase [Deltaproteobacteria bacterium]
MLLAILVACLTGWLSILCLSLYAHRAMAHRSVAFHPAVTHAMRFCLWLTTGVNIREWVAVHRKHHATVDTPEDPHSPVVHGLARIFFFGLWYYRRAARDPETLEKYGKGCPDDWIERHVYARFPNLCLVLLGAIDLALFDIGPGLVAFAIQLVWTPIVAAGIINGFGHAIGYRDFDTNDGSTNIIPFGLVVSGEELHNNHHRYPRSAKFSTRAFEFDLGWWVVRAFAAFRLASDLYIYDRKLAHHKVERATEKLETLFAKWRDAAEQLRVTSARSLAEKRARFDLLCAEFKCKAEKVIARFDAEARARLLAIREAFEKQMETLLANAFAVPETAA